MQYKKPRVSNGRRGGSRAALHEWAGQLAALEADQYAGYLVVETHVKKRPPGLQMRDGLDGLESNSLDNLDYIRAHLQRLAD